MLPDAGLMLAVIGVAVIHRRGLHLDGAARRRDTGRPTGWAMPLGLLAVLVALTPSLELAAERSFAWHMVQHQLLLLVAAPLIAVSAPVRRLLMGVTGGRRRLGPPRGDAGLWALVAGVAAVAVLLLWHLPPVYDAAMGDVRWHLVEHATLLGSAVLLWLAVLRAARDDRRLGAAVVALAGTAIVGAGLGVVLLTAPQPLYDWYAGGGAAAVQQQQVGGALMKVGALLVNAGAAVGLTLRWLHRMAREERLTATAH